MGFLLTTFSRFTLFLLSLKLEILLCLLTLLWRRSTKPEGSSFLWRVIHSLFLTTGMRTGAPLYWGIDSESSLILSDDKNVVKEACASAIQPFPDDEVYISRRGHVGLEAIFHDYTAEDVEQQPVETEAKHVTGMMTTNGHIRLSRR